jgi:hypothetical protein
MRIFGPNREEVAGGWRRKRPPERPRRGWEDIIRMDIRKIG